MFSFLITCIKTFGLAGIGIYLKIKLNATSSLQLPGIQFPIYLRKNNADKVSFREIFIKRDYDIDLPLLNPKVIVDAGANIGLTTIFLANKYPSAKIFSIEPDDDNFKCLQQNTKRYPNVTPVKSAIWYKKESIQIVDKGYGERGFMIEKNELGITLDGISIGDLMATYKIDSIDILKMDIEGSEKEVFSENYESWLPVTKCLVIELHDRMKPGCSKAVFNALSSYDFALSIKGENLILTNRLFLQ